MFYISLVCFCLVSVKVLCASRLSVFLFKFSLKDGFFLLPTLFHWFLRFPQCEGHSSIKPPAPTLSLGWDFFFPPQIIQHLEEVQEQRLTGQKTES